MTIPSKHKLVAGNIVFCWW